MGGTVQASASIIMYNSYDTNYTVLATNSPNSFAYGGLMKNGISCDKNVIPIYSNTDLVHTIGVPYSNSPIVIDSGLPSYSTTFGIGLALAPLSVGLSIVGTVMASGVIALKSHDVLSVAKGLSVLESTTGKSIDIGVANSSLGTGTVNLYGSSTSGSLILSPSKVIDNQGKLLTATGSVTNSITVSTNTNRGVNQSGATSVNSASINASNNYVTLKSTHSVQLENISLNDNGNVAVSATRMATSDFRLYNPSVLYTTTTGRSLSQLGLPGQGEIKLQVNSTPVTVTQTPPAVTNNSNSQSSARLNAHVISASNNSDFVDPLVLDLNGDGVKMTDSATAPVLFDTTHSGSLHQTGWVSNADGILVADTNNSVDHRIDISQTISEYYGGQVGTNGESGTKGTDANGKEFKNGFDALKTLDVNNDGVFNSNDSAWANLRVWVDANHDGIVNAGELKTFADLGITAINLSHKIQSGEIRDGNEVQATGTFVMNGSSSEMVSANFLSNVAGSTFTTDNKNNGTVISTVAPLKIINGVDANSTNAKLVASKTNPSTISFQTNITTGTSLNANTLNVINLYGNAGDDILTAVSKGSTLDNTGSWLVGGGGSNTYNGGAGNDVFIVTANDKSSNIHGGGGTDMVVVVGSGAVNLNLSQAQVTIAEGGTGDDTIIGGGRSTVFVAGGAGDDTLIGGAANDVLNGDEGEDYVDGGYGNDLLHGGSGADALYGGAGDDIVYSGTGEDYLNGGDGNDVLFGEIANDNLILRMVA